MGVFLRATLILPQESRDRNSESDIGQSCLKTAAILSYQGKITCKSMVRSLVEW
jgi:hypothetical protein